MMPPLVLAQRPKSKIKIKFVKELKKVKKYKYVIKTKVSSLETEIGGILCTVY